MTENARRVNPALDFTMSVWTQALFDAITKLDPGQAISHSEIEHIVGKPMAQCYGAVASARRRARREHAMLFRFAKEGLLRLDDSGVVGTASKAIADVSRKARRSCEDLDRCVAYDKLDENGKKDFNLRRSVLGALAAVSASSSSKRIEAAVVQTRRPLELAETLRQFGGSE